MTSSLPAVWPQPLPPPAPTLRASVVIPARNEADLLPSALRAFRMQVDTQGQPLDPTTLEILVLANNCTDRTAEIARSLAEEFRDGPAVLVAESELPPRLAHVGTARRWLMDCAADRLEAVGCPEGLILSTDADTVVAPDWVAAQLAEVAAGADAVAGLIEVDPVGLRRLGPRVRHSYTRERVHRGRILQLEALIDPDPLDPPPRHDFHGGASLGITVRCYRRVGGLPPLRSLEDVALAEALWRVDARFVHSLLVRVQTSPRLDARAEGGHGQSLAGREAGDVLVRSGAAIEAELRARAGLRRLFQSRQAAGAGWVLTRSDLTDAAHASRIAPDRLAAILHGEPTFGRWLEAIRGFGSGPPRADEPLVPLQVANHDLRARVRTLRRALGST